ISADLHQPFDIEVYFPPQVALDHEMAVDVVSKPRDLVLGQLPDPGLRVEPNGAYCFPALGSANPIDIRKRYVDRLLIGNVNARDSRQPDPPGVASLPLPLLVPGVLADNPHHTMAPNDLAFLTPRLNRCVHFHLRKSDPSKRAALPLTPSVTSNCNRFRTVCGVLRPAERDLHPGWAGRH